MTAVDLGEKTMEGGSMAVRHRVLTQKTPVRHLLPQPGPACCFHPSHTYEQNTELNEDLYLIFYLVLKKKKVKV